MASELPPRDEVKALFDEIVAKLGTHISNTEIPIWDPTAADDVKIKNVQIMLANLQRLTTARSDAEYRKFFRRFRALAPDSWTSISDGLSPDGKSKLIQATSTRLAAQKEEERLAQARKQKRDEARAQREADKARKPAAAAAASSSSSASHPATDDRERALEKTKADQLAAAADAGRANVILEDEEQGKRLVEERRLQEDVRVLQEQIRLEEERLKEEANRMQQLMQGRAILLRNARQLQHDLGQVDVHDLKRQMFAEEKVALNRRIDVYITEIESFVDPSQIADLGGKIVPLRKTYEALVEAVKQERNEQNEREFQERKRQLLAEADVLSALFAELKALPKTGSSSINTRLRNLDAEFPAYRPLVQSLTADNHQMEDVLRDKALEFKTSFETLTRSINEVNDLLARLRRITQGLQDRLNQLQQQLELIDELNKPLLELQQQIRIYSGLLDQNESQNKQSLELIVPAIEQLVKKVDELDRQVGEKINELQKRLHDLRSDAPRDEERFYLTKGGWVVKKVASNFTVVGKIVADLPPNQKNYVIKPITADIRDEAKKIERYQFSKIEIRGGDLSMDEIRGRNLSPANAALFTAHKDDPLPKLPPPVVYGYYGFYKDSDVVGFAVADQDVPEAERSKLKFYAVGKHKIVGGKLQIQFDSNFDPRAWNIMTTQLPAPNMVVPERRRYRHEDYASDFPMPASELGKVPRINYFLCKGGIVLKFTEHEDGDKVELIARWSLNQGKTHIQISLIDDASKQKYRNLLDQRFDDEAIPLKQYRQHVGLIDLTDVASVRGLTIDAVTLTSHLNLSGNYYIYEGGHLVFHIGDGADEKKYVLGKCVLDGNKIKFNYANTLPTEDVITGKKHVQLVVKNADYADYSNVKGGVPNTVLDLLPEDEKKKELDKRLLKESRHYSPVPRPDVEFAAVGGGLPVEVSGPVSTDKTPGDLYLYNGGIVVEEKTIERNIAKKVVGRWELDGDHLKMKTVMPEEGERLQSLLDLSGPQAKKMKVVNSPVVD